MNLGVFSDLPSFEPDSNASFRQPAIMLAKQNPMDWKKYEKEILEFLSDDFPDAEITHYVSRKGRYSKRSMSKKSKPLLACWRTLVHIKAYS